MPLEANDRPGFALAYLTRSWIEFTGRDALTMRMNGTSAMPAIGTKSTAGL